VTSDCAPKIVPTLEARRYGRHADSVGSLIGSYKLYFAPPTFLN
jgi:hypothetical protein